MMSKFWRAALVSATATAAVTAGWVLLKQWSERAVQVGEGIANFGKQRSREEIVEDLSDAQQQQLLDELSRQL